MGLEEEARSVNIPVVCKVSGFAVCFSTCYSLTDLLLIDPAPAKKSDKKKEEERGIESNK